MQFLLVVPINSTTLCTAPGEPTPSRGPLDSRAASHPTLLIHDWGRLPNEYASADPALRLDRAQICTVRERQYIAISVTMTERLEERLASSELERRLSAFAHGYIIKQTPLSSDELPWVARYALLGPDDTPPQNWTDARVHAVDLSHEADVENGHSVRALMGWGNGVVFGWNHLTESSQQQLLHGIIDAQVIWHDASQIVEENERVFKRVISEIERPQRSSVKEISPEFARVQISASLHQLLFDDLIQNVQGLRRATAELLLGAWGYERMVTRMLARVEDTYRQLDSVRATLDSKYHSAVQTTLLLLGLLVLIDTALAFISTAHSGSTATDPGGDSGMFAQLRAGDADIILSVAIAVTVGMALIFARRR